MIKRLQILLVALLLSSPAMAVPVTLEYNGVVSFSDNALVTAGQNINIEIRVDNGGTDLNNQSWDLDDLISIDMSAGNYYANVTGTTHTSSPFDVQTDSSGSLSVLNIAMFFEILGDDSFGGAPLAFFLNGLNHIWQASSFGLIEAVAPPTIANTNISIDPTPVPLPATGLLLLASLGTFAAWRRLS